MSKQNRKKKSKSAKKFEIEKEGRRNKRKEKEKKSKNAGEEIEGKETEKDIKARESEETDEYLEDKKNQHGNLGVFLGKSSCLIKKFEKKKSDH